MLHRLLYAILILALLICAAPILSVAWAGWFAESHGCILHEGAANPCIVDGEDWGQTLYTAFVLGWLMLVTVPAGAIVAIALAILIIIDIVRKIRQ